MTEQKRMQTNGLAAGGLVLGILGMVSFWTIYGGLIFGGLAVTLSLLSRGRFRLGGMAVAGLVCGVIAVAAAFVLFAGVSFVLMNGGTFHALGSVSGLSSLWMAAGGLF